ncbi:hypothetical protein HK100_004902 [Physocladia obscura]|uniref:poly(A)-specific ribonuclease n=1 Tax=Physocladia obscura TaxID=109957 RepID=A0AAD5XIZ5_9FUNG|nr:hypothetical protein HK100_004902 [Physocladia obscura]
MSVGLELVKRMSASVAFAVAFPVLTLAELFFALISPTKPFVARGKIILITGASSGIGAALAIKYAQLGASLVICARRKDELEVIGARCKNAGATHVWCEVLDVADEEAVKTVIQKAGEHFGRIDCVVLNAGISMGEFVRSFNDVSAWKKIMDINFTGFVSGIVYSLPFLKKSQRGKVVGVSSILGLAAGPLRTGFCASKFAMKGFMDSIRLEEPGIDFTMIYPNVVATDSNRIRIGSRGKLISDKTKAMMSSEEAADLIVAAVNRGAKDDIFSFEGNLLYYIKDVFPRVRDVLLRKAFKNDTEFPGVVARPIGSFKTSADYQYQTLRCNVDLLKIIQLGVTFADENGNTPPNICTWQFNFKFNLNDDMYAQDSIDLLTKSGIDFKKHEEYGIDVEHFGELLISSGFVLLNDVKWISFHSGYDFGYLLKVATCSPLPAEESEFFELMKLYFPCVYDIKYLMKSCKNLKGGLQDVADDLQIPRIGPQHQAGSDSLLTSKTFFKMRETFFDDQIDEDKYMGYLYGILKILISSFFVT